MYVNGPWQALPETGIYSLFKYLGAYSFYLCRLFSVALVVSG